MKALTSAFLASCLLASFSESQARLTFANVNNDSESHEQKEDATSQKFNYYIGKNARWLVDLQLNVISAWELERDVPLWSRDGVVFRVFQRPNNAISDFNKASTQSPLPATEIFGRVYFFLNDDLIALDSRAQGRLVWRRNIKEFIPFFTSFNPTLADAPVFIPEIFPLNSDRLLIQTRRGQETQCFILDAASGEFRLALPEETNNMQR